MSENKTLVIFVKGGDFLKIYFGVLLFIIVIVITLTFIHLPNKKLDVKTKELIRQRGLIHFTTKENLVEILKHGFKGKISEMSLMEKRMGEMIWFYIQEPHKNLEHLNIVKRKHRKSEYEVGIIVSDFTDEEFDKMRIRKGLFKDNAVIYLGEMKCFEKMRIYSPKEKNEIFFMDIITNLPDKKDSYEIKLE